MKSKILLTLAIAAATLSANAQTTSDAVIETGSARNISIASYMHVVLVPATAAQTSLSVNQKAAQTIQVQSKGDYIGVEPVSYAASKSTVYLVVNDVRTLLLGENVLVETKGILNAPRINVVADAHTKAYLTTRGKVTASSLWEAEVSVRPITAVNPVSPAM